MSEAAKVTLVLLLAALLTAGSATAGTLFDPTRPPTLKAGPEVAEAPPPPLDVSSWSLDTVVISDGRRLAVVNGRSLRVGQKVDGAEVVEILPYLVKLKHRGKVFELRLSGGGFAVPAEK